MLRHIDRITWRNGWHLNGRPAHVAEIRPIFDGASQLHVLYGKSTKKKKRNCVSKISLALPMRLAVAFSQRLWAYEHPPVT